jgi:ABC-type dipeptide/oligopeptide/nickel transport system permease subunit
MSDVPDVSQPEGSLPDLLPQVTTAAVIGPRDREGVLPTPGPEHRQLPAGAPSTSTGDERLWVKKWKRDIQVFTANRFALVSFVFLVLIVLFCFVGPIFYKSNQTSATLLNQNLPPSGQFPFGTNAEGFDMLGRLMLGGQSTLEIGFAVAVFATGFGALWGAIAGYVGGVVDALLMRIVDTTLSIPFLFLAVLVATLLQPSLWLIVVAITAVSWPSTARIVRGETLSLRSRDYVTAARGFGAWQLRLIGRHILPNSVGSIIVNATLKVATAILIAATLAFLGLAVPPPATTWGQTITRGLSNIVNPYWWELWIPAAALVLTVLAVSGIGDGLYDVVAKRNAAGKSAT